MVVRVGVEVYGVSEVTEFLINPRRREASSPGCVGVDCENSAWSLHSDLHSNSLRFPFYLRDIDKIPRNHLRLGTLPMSLFLLGILFYIT